MSTCLTDQVLEFQSTGAGLEKILSEVSLRIYRYPWRKYGWAEDDCSDFFISFYEKIPGLVERFNHTGFSFETYLFSTMKWQMRTFIQKKKQSDTRSRVLENECFLTGAGIETGIEHGTVVSEQACEPYLVKKLTKSMRKRILFLAMKGCLSLTAERIERIARLTEIEIPILNGYVESLVSRLAPKLARVAALRERRNKLFFRIQCLQEDYRASRHDADLGRYYGECIDHETKRLSDIQNEIAHIPLFPSHRDIAEVLGVPKGTVDSGLFYLKTSFETLYQDGDIRYA